MKSKEELRIYKRDWARNKYGRTEKSLNNSNTYKGRTAELLALSILEGGKDMNSEIMNQSYDIEWNDFKIDVKSCELYKRKKKRGKIVSYSSGWWVFNKNKGYSDYYFCICMINNEPARYYLIPKDDFNNGITVGQKSKKFDKYLINKKL